MKKLFYLFEEVYLINLLEDFLIDILILFTIFKMLYKVSKLIYYLSTFQKEINE